MSESSDVRDVEIGDRWRDAEHEYAVVDIRSVPSGGRVVVVLRHPERKELARAVKEYGKRRRAR